MGSLRGTEVYYQKFIELQEKLRKSEEERLKLEMKFNEMVQCTQDEEQAHYRKLRHQYKRFLEEDRRRQERNEAILRALERVEGRASMLAAKTERYRFLRRQYQNFVKKLQRNQATFKESQEEASSGYKSSQNFDRSATNDIIEKYFQSLSSEERKKDDLQERNQRYPFTMPHSHVDYSKHDMEERNLLEGHNAVSVADEIMKSIYSKRLAFGEKLPILNNKENHIERSDVREEQRENLTQYDKYYQPQMQLENRYPSNVQGMNENVESFIRKPYSNTVKFAADDQDERFSVLERRNEGLAVNHNEGSKITPGNFVEDKRLIPDLNEQENLDKSREFVEIVNKHLKSSDRNKGESLVNEEPPKELDEALENVDEVIGKQIHSNDLQDNIRKTVEEHVDFKDEHEEQQKQRKKSLQQSSVDEEVKSENADPATLQQGDETCDQYTLQRYAENEEPIRREAKQEQHNGAFDEQGQSYQNYDENGQPLPQYDDSDQALQQYDDGGQSFQQYGENGQALQQYDDSGQALQQYDDCGQAFQQYDNNGQPLQQYDDSGQALQQYDNNGQVLQQYVDSGQELQQFDDSGQGLQQYDDGGQPTQHYDNNDQMLQQYDENGQLLEQYDENGQPLQQYDDNGQSYQQYDAYDQQNQALYDENGQPAQQYDEYGQPLPYEQQYDESDQPTYDQQSQQYYQYDENGQPLQNYQQQEQGYDPNQYPVDEQQAQVADQYSSGNVQEPQGSLEQQCTVEKRQETNDEQKLEKVTTKVVEDEKKPHKVIDMLDTDTESSRQDTKASHDSDFDLSAVSQQ